MNDFDHLSDRELENVLMRRQRAAQLSRQHVAIAGLQSYPRQAMAALNDNYRAADRLLVEAELAVARRYFGPHTPIIDVKV